jgi:hypothetical protein
MMTCGTRTLLTSYHLLTQVRCCQAHACSHCPRVCHLHSLVYHPLFHRIVHSWEQPPRSPERMVAQMRLQTKATNSSWEWIVSTLCQARTKKQHWLMRTVLYGEKDSRLYERPGPQHMSKKKKKPEVFGKKNCFNTARWIHFLHSVLHRTVRYAATITGEGTNICTHQQRNVCWVVILLSQR